MKGARRRDGPNLAPVALPLSLRASLKAPCDALRFLEHARYTHEVPDAALARTRPVRGKSGCMTWLLPHGRPWPPVVRDKRAEQPACSLAISRFPDRNILAPNGKVAVGARSSLTGAAWGSEVAADMRAQITSRPFAAW